MTRSSKEAFRDPEGDVVAGPENSKMRLLGIPVSRAASRTVGSVAGCAMMSVARVLVSWKTGGQHEHGHGAEMHLVFKDIAHQVLRMSRQGLPHWA